MEKSKFLWARLTDDALDEPCSSHDLVDAFNGRDADAVKRVLEENPGALHDTGFFWTRPTKNGYYQGGMSAAEAAVHMGWAAVLPVLHAAGDLFDRPRDIGALAMATAQQKSGCAKKLLKLGAGLERVDDGLAPIARLNTRWAVFEKNKIMRGIGLAYIKAGQDPWSETGSGAAIIYLLKNTAIPVVIDMLHDQVRHGKRAPESVNTNEFWQALVEGTGPLFAHFSPRPVISHIQPWCDLVELARQVGIVPDEDSLAAFANVAVKKMDDATLSLHHRAKLMTGFTKVATVMAQAMPDPHRGLACLLDIIEDHEEWIDPAIMAQCRNDLMQSDTPAANKPAGRASRRF